MRFLVALLVAGVMSGQSNPSWWKYTPPDSTAIVGIQWKTMRTTMFAPLIAAEMAPGGSLGFPNLDVVRNPDQVLIGGPQMLAVEYGTFPAAKLRTQASAAGMRRTTYKSVEVWVSPEADIHSVAFLNEKLLLVGTVDAIEEAVARVADPRNRAYSPLMARAARYSKEDLWVVTSALPDRLASVFVPFEIEATGFEGAVSAWGGLHAVASLERSSATKALDFADSLAETMASRPALAEGTEITTKDRAVLIRLDLNEEQLASSLRTTPAAPVTVAVTAPVSAAVPVHPVPMSPAKVSPNPKPTVVSELIPEVSVDAPQGWGSPQTQLPAPPKPRTVKILGLDNGPREIPLDK